MTARVLHDFQNHGLWAELLEDVCHEVLETIKGVLPLVVALTAAWLAIDFATHLVT